MEIEIWSDVICPFCGLGSKRLENALAQFEHADRVEVIHRHFELDASYPVGRTDPVRQKLQAKYGISAAQVEANAARIEGDAVAEGLSPYRTLDNVFGNTALAHQLLVMAGDHGRAAEAWERMYRAYFGEARDIFSVDGLVELAGEIGLDVDELREALTDGRYDGRVKADTRQAQQLGATGVPFIVIDRRYAIAGAQPTATMLEVIRTAWNDRPQRLTVLGDGDGDGDAGCGPAGCSA